MPDEAILLPAKERSVDGDAPPDAADSTRASGEGATGRESWLLGQIEMREQVGVGSMARVFRGFQHGVDRDVAVKVLHPKLSANRDVVERFHREARVASRLVHPHVVQVLLTAQLPPKDGRDDGELVLVMEYLDGMTLSEALADAGGAFDLARAVHIVLQVCDAVGEAHVQGVVHRDLKPENVMLVRRGDDHSFVKVLDFGLARLTQKDAAPATRAGAVFGSPRYISPEGAQGLPVTPAADVYAIATLFYQCLAGRTPFEADTAVALLLAHATEEAPPLSSHERSAGVPTPVADVVMKNLAKDADARDPDARSFARSLVAAVTAAGLAPDPLVARLGWLSGGALEPALRAKIEREIGASAAGMTILADADPAPPSPTLCDTPSSSAVGTQPASGRSRGAHPAEKPGATLLLDDHTSGTAARSPSVADPRNTLGTSALAPHLFGHHTPPPSHASSVLPLQAPMARPSPYNPPAGETPTSGVRYAHEPLAPAHESERPHGRAYALIALCFLAGAAAAVVGVAGFGGWRTSSPGGDPRADAILMAVHEAVGHRAFDAPPADNARELIARGRSEFPADPRFVAEQRELSSRLLGLASGEKQAGNRDEALHLARLASELDGENDAAGAMLRDLIAPPPAPVASDPPQPRRAKQRPATAATGTSPARTPGEASSKGRPGPAPSGEVGHWF